MLPRMGSSKRPSHSSTARLLVMTILLREQHGHHLMPASYQRVENLRLGVTQRAHRRSDRFGKMGKVPHLSEACNLKITVTEGVTTKGGPPGAMLSVVAFQSRLRPDGSEAED